MKINGFSHVNVRTSRLDDMIAWYSDILDMHPGPRPDFRFGGAWLYAGDKPFIHLVEVQSEPRVAETKIEHFAFDASGMSDLAAKLEASGNTYTVDRVPGFPLVQINCHDPDGNHIHIDFSLDDTKDAGLA
ncbi:MAG: glyoxalase [Silicimonas sp.]|nr:glyoxalase [Silicimonas sp.]